MSQTAASRLSGLSAWASRAPIAVFLAGTFLWAWLLWGYWIPAMPPGGLEVSLPFVLCAIVGGFAPSLAAIGTVWLGEGRAGVASLLGRLLDWKRAPWLYAVALLLAPAAFLTTMVLQLAMVGALKSPDPALVPVAMIWPLLAALGEEIGWRGFLFPRLQSRFGIVAAALILGVIWGVWHLPADYIALKGYGGWFLAAFLVNGPLVLTAHALIMAWIWKRSDGSLPLMVLYHLTITAGAMLTPAAGTQGASGVAAAAIGAAVFSVLAAGLWLFEIRRTNRASART